MSEGFLGYLLSYLRILLVAINFFELHLIIIVPFLKDHILHLPANKVQLPPKFPLLDFLAFLKSFHTHLHCNGVRKRAQFPLHQIGSKAFEQVIWLRISHLMGEISSEIICSLGRSRKCFFFPRPRWEE